MNDSDEEEENRKLRGEDTVGWRFELYNDFFRKQAVIKKGEFGEEIEVIRLKDAKIFYAKK